MKLAVLPAYDKIYHNLCLKLENETMCQLSVLYEYPAGKS